MKKYYILKDLPTSLYYYLCENEGWWGDMESAHKFEKLEDATKGFGW